MTEEDAEMEASIEEDEVEQMDEMELLEYNFEQYWKKLKTEANSQLVEAVFGLASPKLPTRRSRLGEKLKRARLVRPWRLKRRAKA